MGRSSSFAALSHFRATQTDCSQELAAFTLGPSFCCCWQILCQEITKRTAASSSLGSWPQWRAGSPDWPGPCPAEALKLSWPGPHCWGPWLIGQDVTASSQFALGFGILFLQHLYMCFLCSLTCFFFLQGNTSLICHVSVFLRQWVVVGIALTGIQLAWGLVLELDLE